MERFVERLAVFRLAPAVVVFFVARFFVDRLAVFRVAFLAVFFLGEADFFFVDRLAVFFLGEAALFLVARFLVARFLVERVAVLRAAFLVDRFAVDFFLAMKMAPQGWGTHLVLRISSPGYPSRGSRAKIHHRSTRCRPFRRACRCGTNVAGNALFCSILFRRTQNTDVSKIDRTFPSVASLNLFTERGLTHRVYALDQFFVDSVKANIILRGFI